LDLKRSAAVERPADDTAADSRSANDATPPGAPAATPPPLPPPEVVQTPRPQPVAAQPASGVSAQTADSESRPQAAPAKSASIASLPAAEQVPPLRGYQHGPDKRWTVYYLAGFLAAAAVFGVVPAVLDVVQHVGTVDSAGVARWAWILLLVGGVQCAYAVYLAQLPDWASVRVISIVTLALASGYAMLLGNLLLAGRQGQLLRFLELTEPGGGNRAALWCLMMLGITILLAYFSGRISGNWCRSYRLAIRDVDGAASGQ
jgi:hypothetical protein